MTRGQKRSLVRRSHRWVGSVASVLLLVAAGSGILLQHPELLGAVNNEPLSLAADPTDPARMLRGTHWGVEVSTDGGRHWREVPMLAAPTDVRRILFVASGSTEQVVYAMGRQTLVRSGDGGRVWAEVVGPADPALLAAEFLDLVVNSAGELNLLTNVGLYERDHDGGWGLVGGRPEHQRDWQQWLHDLHTGQVFGLLGRRTAEGGAWALVLLTVSGLVLHLRVRKKRTT